jgi:hypothetical protein
MDSEKHIFWITFENRAREVALEANAEDHETRFGIRDKNDPYNSPRFRVLITRS